jgi:predicted nucleotidyltransferase
LDTQNLTELLQEITHRIRETTTPERIILFGSYARGDPGPDSDLDMLVIVRGVQHTRQETLRGLLVPIDVIVATPEQVERYRDSIGLVYGPALREGKVLYERAPAA